MTTVGEQIRNARKKKGLTQEQLAEKVDRNLRTIQRIEKNDNEPSQDTLNMICEVLEIDSNELNLTENSIRKNIGTKIINGLFLIALNLVLMGIIGFLTLDSNANMNSRVGGYLLSVFLPFFIVVMTKKMSGMERILKFGTGYIVYFILVMVKPGFPTGFVTGLFPCFLISLSVLYFGNELIKNRE